MGSNATLSTIINTDDAVRASQYWALLEEQDIMAKEPQKVPLQLLIEYSLKQRLQNIKDQTGIPISKTISEVLGRHLVEFETNHGVQPQLPTD